MSFSSDKASPESKNRQPDYSGEGNTSKSAQNEGTPWSVKFDDRAIDLVGADPFTRKENPHGSLVIEDTHSQNGSIHSDHYSSSPSEFRQFLRKGSFTEPTGVTPRRSSLSSMRFGSVTDSGHPISGSSTQSERDVCMPIDTDDLKGSSGINFTALNKFYDLIHLDSDTASESSIKMKQSFQNRKYSVCEETRRSRFPNKDEKTPAMDSVNTGRFSFFRAQKPATVHVANFCDLLSDKESFEDLFNNKNGPWWLDVKSPTDAEMELFASAFVIHPLTVEDITTQETREKVELFENYFFVIFQSFQDDSTRKSFIKPLNMYIVAFRAGVLSFHFDSCPHPANVRRRIRRLRDFLRISAEWIPYALIDDITDAFLPKIRQLEQNTDAIEENVLLARSADESGVLLQEIMGCRRKVTETYRLLHGKIDVVKMFAKRCNLDYQVAPTSEIGLFLGDIQDHLITMTSSLVQCERTLSRTLSNYLAYLSVDAIHGNNRINATLGRLTIIGTILVPLNVITGLFGMNVRVPGQPVDGKYENLAWFFGIVGVMVLFSVTFLLASRKINFT